MWDRLTASTPTVTLESRTYFRQPIRRFSTPPVPLVDSPVFPRCTGVCVLRNVSFGHRSGLASEALRVLLRGFVVIPLFTQGQPYAVYLFFTTGEEVGQSHLSRLM